MHTLMTTCAMLLAIGCFAQKKKDIKTTKDLGEALKRTGTATSTSTTSERLILMPTHPSTYRQIQIQNGTSRQYISIGQVDTKNLTIDQLSATNKDSTIVKHVVVHTDSIKATIYFHGIVDSVLFNGKTYKF